jgi:hypothetical protein
MTSATMQGFPEPSITNLDFFITSPTTNSDLFDMVAYVLGQFPTLAAAGISGYPSVFQNQASGSTWVSGMQGRVIMTNNNNNNSSSSSSNTSFSGAEEDILAVLQPVFDGVEENWPGVFTVAANTRTYDSFHAWYADCYDGSPSGYSHVMGSRLLDETALAADPAAVRDAMRKFAAGGHATVYIVSGKGVWEAEPRGGGNAVSPGWRRAIVHASKYTSANLLFFL